MEKKYNYSEFHVTSDRADYEKVKLKDIKKGERFKILRKRIPRKFIEAVMTHEGGCDMFNRGELFYSIHIKYSHPSWDYSQGEVMSRGDNIVSEKYHTFYKLTTEGLKDVLEQEQIQKFLADNPSN